MSASKKSEQVVVIWIVVLLVVYVATIVGLLEIFRESNPALSFPTRLLGFLQSPVFDTLTISILIPIFLLLMNVLFRIRGAVEDHIENHRQTRITLRMQALERISQTWNELYDICTEVAYFRKDEALPDQIDEFSKRLTLFTSRTEDTLSLSWVRFPVHREEIELFRYFVNVLVESTSVVIHAMRNKNNRRIKDLQRSLMAIRNGIKDIVHEPMLSVLNDSIHRELFDGEQTQDNQNAEIREILDQLRKDRLDITKEENKYFRIFPSLRGKKIELLRKAAENDSDDFERLFYSIPHRELIAGYKNDYTEEFVMRLADILIFKSLVLDLRERSEPEISW